MPVVPELWEAMVSGSREVSSLGSAWPTWQKPISTKNTKISQPWWHMPVIPGTWEAEAGELLKPWWGRWRLQRAKVVPLHTGLGNKSETPSQKKEKNTKNNLMREEWTNSIVLILIICILLKLL